MNELDNNRSYKNFQTFEEKKPLSKYSQISALIHEPIKKYFTLLKSSEPIKHATKALKATHRTIHQGLKKVKTATLVKKTDLQNIANQSSEKEKPKILIGAHRVGNVAEAHLNKTSLRGANPLNFASMKDLCSTLSTQDHLDKPENLFSDEFKSEDDLVLTEQALRASTVEMLLEGMESQLASLDRDGEEYSKTKSQLERYREASENATWGSTNTPRYAFKKFGIQGAKQRMVPIVCNLRMQLLKDPTGNIISSVTRSGALTDFRHGEVSLEELKDYAAMVNVGYEGSVKDVIKLNALISYGTDLIKGAPGEEVVNVLDKINLGKKLNREDLNILQNEEIDANKLDRIINERTGFLEKQALQDLYIHLKTRPASQSQIVYGRTSLLDTHKERTNSYGCIIDEKTQGLDMKALFNGLDGRSVLFDLESSAGPYIDKEGKLHFPSDCGVPGLKETQLNTLYMNISVQGNIKNEGVQKLINDDTLNKLEILAQTNGKLLQDLNNLKEVIKQLPEGKDPFEVALLVFRCFKTLDGYFGVNCFGGKDRTGYLLALITNNFLPQENSKQIMQWHRQLLSVQGVASKIAHENADHKVLKVSRFNLELFSTHSFKGVIYRVNYLMRSIPLGIKSTLLKTLSESQAIGQLYKKYQTNKH